jgi:hypothetical protein
MLDPRFKSFYPELKAGRWLPAWPTAVKRAKHLWENLGADALIQDRVLPDEHFHFRGGKPRDLDVYVARERLTDPTPAELGMRGGDSSEPS